MKTNKKPMLCLLLSFSCGSLHVEVLNIAVHEFCLFLCEPTKEDGGKGYVAGLLTAIYEPAGFTLKFHRVPYARGIHGTEQGIYDGMPMLNSRSSQMIAMSEEVCGKLVQNFYVRKGDPWVYDGLKSPENIKIGSILG